MPDSRQREKLSVKKQRKIFWISIATMIVSLFFVLLQFWRAQIGLPITIGTFVGTIALCAILVSMHRRLRDQLLKTVQAARPGAPIIPTSNTRATRQDAQSAGVSTMNLGITATIALAVPHDRVEVWVRGDLSPRWTIWRAGAEISVQSILVRPDGIHQREPGIRISNGGWSVHCLPCYPGIPAWNRVAQIERALRDLGENPAEHLEE